MTLLPEKFEPETDRLPFRTKMPAPAALPAVPVTVLLVKLLPVTVRGTFVGAVISSAPPKCRLATVLLLWFESTVVLSIDMLSPGALPSAW